jgi:hypothetical protein
MKKYIDKKQPKDLGSHLVKEIGNQNLDKRVVTIKEFDWIERLMN